MILTTLFVIAGVAAVATPVGGWLAGRRWDVKVGLLVGTALLAVAVLAFAVAWILKVDPGRGPADAVRSGALAAGAVLALYGLWLNDRRRQMEEKNHKLEIERSGHDRERVASERFARAVELLGNEADHVRVGALHALVGLAKTWPDMRQTVGDILCAYLRRPFDHGEYRKARGAAEPADDAEKADNERQVRLTAQRLIQDLLAMAAEPMRLDLTGAVLEQFTLRSVKLSALVADNAQFYRATTFDTIGVSTELSLREAALFGDAKFVYCNLTSLTLDGATFRADTDFSYSVLSGRCRALTTRFLGSLQCGHMSFGADLKWRIEVTGSASFREATFNWGADLSNSQFRGDATFDGAYLLVGESPHEPTTFDGVTFGQSLSFRIGEPIPNGFVGGMRVRPNSDARLPQALEVVPQSNTWHLVRRRL